MKKVVLFVFATVAPVFGAMGAGQTQDMMFGGEADVGYAGQLWTAMEEARMVGANGLVVTTHKGGNPPHTETLISLQGNVTVDGVTGLAIVKKNFGGEGVNEEAIFADPNKFLRMITVMFQRERGYDSDHQDWFWAAFTPNGQVAMNPQGMAMAGRVAKGMDTGCIACHDNAPGGDYVFLHDAVPAR